MVDWWFDFCKQDNNYSVTLILPKGLTHQWFCLSLWIPAFPAFCDVSTKSLRVWSKCAVFMLINIPIIPKYEQQIVQSVQPKERPLKPD